MYSADDRYLQVFSFATIATSLSASTLSIFMLALDKTTRTT
jgi:hypothetical protein